MKHILITGGNTGIGFATATALAKEENTIILACRNISKANEAIQQIKNKTSNSEIYALECDLSHLDSIRTCAQEYKKQFGKLDLLINNAGLVTDKLQFTKDGFELQFGVNHLGHFLLTTELIELLLKSEEARIINVSSGAHYRGKINFDSFEGEIGHDRYNGMAAYSQSKLANVLFTKELAIRYPNIISHSLHPGVVGTSIAAKNDNSKLWKIVWKVFSPFMLSPDKGARTSIYLATSKEPLKINGRYFQKRKETKPAELAFDIELAEKLWKVSERLVGLGS